MVRREEGDEWFGEHRGRDEAVNGLGVADDSGIDITGEQTIDDARGERFMELELHAGVGRDVPRQDLRQRRKHPGSDKPNVQPAGLPVTDAARLVNVCFDVAQRPASTLEKR